MKEAEERRYRLDMSHISGLSVDDESLKKVALSCFFDRFLVDEPTEDKPIQGEVKLTSSYDLSLLSSLISSMASFAKFYGDFAPKSSDTVTVEFRTSKTGTGLILILSLKHPPLSIALAPRIIEEKAKETEIKTP